MQNSQEKKSIDRYVTNKQNNSQTIIPRDKYIHIQIKTIINK